MRIDDVDRVRCVEGATDWILRQLDSHGLHWDGAIIYQSEQDQFYVRALAELEAKDLSFPCGCSRRVLIDGRYPGICRDGMKAGMSTRSIRLKSDHTPVHFGDAVQGECKYDVWGRMGDFVVHRADGFVAYHLATVVDDARQGITEIVRGADLLESAACQILLQRGLNLSTPGYAHVPVVSNHAGDKLSKQTNATALEPSRAACSLVEALEFLGQAPPSVLMRENPREILSWGIENWRLDQVPKVGTVIKS